MPRSPVSSSTRPPLESTANAPLASRTTLGVGGPARFLARCRDIEELVGILEWARSRELAVFVLGGGSNLLVADAGFGGLVIELADDAVELSEEGDAVRLRAGAGADWDAVVARSVAEGLGGLECLSGIPGRVGAVPIQNVGAYGQEVSETIVAVDVVELATGERQTLVGESCGFAYRHSHFKGRWRGRYAVTRVDFVLPRRAAGTVRYPDLRRRFAAGSEPTLAEVRRAVLAVRRSKSMVIDPGDPNRRSAGSFFFNPVVTAAQAEEVHVRAGAVADRAMPSWEAGEGRVKLSAAWLMEAAGFARGDRLGRAGLSTRHCLALINRGGASAAEIVALAAKVRSEVRAAFGVTLVPEPVFLGFGESIEELLDGKDEVGE